MDDDINSLTEAELADCAESCTEKEQAFAREYVVDLNGTQAIFRCGKIFHVSTADVACITASRMLARARVRAFIDTLKAQRHAQTSYTADKVIQEMAILAHSDYSHYRVDAEGQIQLAEGAPEGAMRAIASVKHRKTIKEDRNGNVEITHHVEFKLWDKPAPLKLMGRQVGLYADKVEVTGKDGAPLEMVTRIERVVVDPLKKVE